MRFPYCKPPKIHHKTLYQKIFDYMHDEHNVILLKSDMNEIINIVEKHNENINKSKKCRVMCLKNYNIVESEHIAPYYRCVIIGWIWRYIPDLTFKNRRYMIVDV